MANNERGEVGFEAGGEKYALRFDIDALCQLEAVTGKSVVEIFQLLAAPDKWSLTFARSAIMVGIDRPVSKDVAGEIIVSIGGLVEAMRLIASAIEKAFPAPEAGKTKSRPRKAAGTG